MFAKKLHYTTLKLTLNKKLLLIKTGDISPSIFNNTNKIREREERREEL